MKNKEHHKNIYKFILFGIVFLASFIFLQGTNKVFGYLCDYDSGRADMTLTYSNNPGNNSSGLSKTTSSTENKIIAKIENILESELNNDADTNTEDDTNTENDTTIDSETILSNLEDSLQSNSKLDGDTTDSKGVEHYEDAETITNSIKDLLIDNIEEIEQYNIKELSFDNIDNLLPNNNDKFKEYSMEELLSNNSLVINIKNKNTDEITPFTIKTDDSKILLLFVKNDLFLIYNELKD